jgi:hypothetical protein
MDRMAAVTANWPHASLVLVTTGREHHDADAARRRLPDLAHALHSGGGSYRVVARFTGLLPADQLAALATRMSGRPYAECVAAAEEALALLPSTPLLAADLVDQARRAGIDAWHYHHPDPQAGMVQQINLAARAETARLTAVGIEQARLWIAVYNADSRPDPPTLPAAAAIIGRGQRLGRPVQVVQQSALFTANLPSLPGGGRGAFLTGAALLQSRWTLAREIPRLSRQARQAGSRWWPRLAHCVGHGLFVNAAALATLGGLPETTMNEDLAFGYLACAAGIPIYPLPLLEWADAPETVTGSIRQARQWFWSYVEYPRAARLASQASHGTRWSRAVLAGQGVTRGALWLGQSPAIAGCLALPLLDRRARAAAAAAAAAAVTVYLAVPLVLLGRHPQVRAALGHGVGPRELAGGLAAALAASVGPWWCLANAVHRRLTGASYDHDKTER